MPEQSRQYFPRRAWAPHGEDRVIGIRGSVELGAELAADLPQHVDKRGVSGFDGQLAIDVAHDDPPGWYLLQGGGKFAARPRSGRLVHLPVLCPATRWEPKHTGHCEGDRKFGARGQHEQNSYR